MDRDSLWAGEKVVVTDGAGFLGTYIVEVLRKRGCTEIFIPCSVQYDLG